MKGVVNESEATPVLYGRSMAYLRLRSVVNVKETAGYVSSRNSARIRKFDKCPPPPPTPLTYPPLALVPSPWRIMLARELAKGA